MEYVTSDIVCVQVDSGRTFTEPSAIMSGDVENQEQVRCTGLIYHDMVSVLLVTRDTRVINMCVRNVNMNDVLTTRVGRRSST